MLVLHLSGIQKFIAINLDKSYKFKPRNQEIYFQYVGVKIVSLILAKGNYF